ncbi:MAG: copper amine oxidase N-terminal domain-containing protein [Ruminococcaceae bacterium]|nr:copper amine oxidase N-terminal domain-containing protein [Oscillospiraceae bacterium]
MMVNGESKEIDVAPVIVNNRTLIPLRACSEAFGLEVQWNEKAGVAKIIKPVSVVSRDGYGGYVYDSNGRVWFEQKRKVDARFKKDLEPEDIRSETYYKYDEFGNSVEETEISGLAGGGVITNRTIANTYDNKNRLIKQVITRTINQGNGDIPLGKETYTREYNEYNQITRLEDSDGLYKTWTYNENGQLLICETNSPPGILEYRYDANGNEIYKNDSKDIYVSEYNELNQKTKTSVYFSEKGITEKPYSTYEYTYDEEGRLINEAYNSLSIGSKTYYYNELGLLEKTVNAATNGAKAVITTVYNYDDNGNLISEGQLSSDGSLFITCEYAVVYR